jgi:hypothetical protein
MHSPTPSELDSIYRSIVGWAAPLVVLAIVHYLHKIAGSLHEIKIQMATSVLRLETHEKKLDEHSEAIKTNSKRISFLEGGCPIFQHQHSK